LNCFNVLKFQVDAAGAKGNLVKEGTAVPDGYNITKADDRGGKSEN
jgi:hypothetical protein